MSTFTICMILLIYIVGVIITAASLDVKYNNRMSNYEYAGVIILWFVLGIKLLICGIAKGLWSIAKSLYNGLVWIFSKK